MRLDDETVRGLLDTWPVARLATRSPDGAPHLVPVVFARHRDALWIPVDGKPKAGGELARVRNVRADDRVALLLDHYDADWSRLWWIRLDGRATVVTDGLAPVGRALRDKYPQYDATEVFRDAPRALRITVRHTRSWCAGDAAREHARGAGGPA